MKTTHHCYFQDNNCRDVLNGIYLTYLGEISRSTLLCLNKKIREQFLEAANVNIIHLKKIIEIGIKLYSKRDNGSVVEKLIIISKILSPQNSLLAIEENYMLAIKNMIMLAYQLSEEDRIAFCDELNKEIDRFPKIDLKSCLQLSNINQNLDPISGEIYLGIIKKYGGLEMRNWYEKIKLKISNEIKVNKAFNSFAFLKNDLVSEFNNLSSNGHFDCVLSLADNLRKFLKNSNFTYPIELKLLNIDFIRDIQILAYKSITESPISCPSALEFVDTIVDLKEKNIVVEYLIDHYIFNKKLNICDEKSVRLCVQYIENSRCGFTTSLIDKLVSYKFLAEALSLLMNSSVIKIKYNQKVNEERKYITNLKNLIRYVCYELQQPEQSLFLANRLGLSNFR